MCLGIPMQIMTINGQVAVCEQGGVQRDVALNLLMEGAVEPGDYVIVHLGFAIECIQQAQAKAAETTWREWIAYTDEKSHPTSG